MHGQLMDSRHFLVHGSLRERPSKHACCQLPCLLQRSPGGSAIHGISAHACPSLAPPLLRLRLQERKSLIGQKLNEKHNNWGSMLLGLGVTISVSGAFNTFLRTGGWVGGWVGGWAPACGGCCVGVGGGVLGAGHWPPAHGHSVGQQTAASA
jgi:hypothetical protein